MEKWARKIRYVYVSRECRSKVQLHFSSSSLLSPLLEELLLLLEELLLEELLLEELLLLLSTSSPSDSLSFCWDSCKIFFGASRSASLSPSVSAPSWITVKKFIAKRIWSGSSVGKSPGNFLVNSLLLNFFCTCAIPRKLTISWNKIFMKIRPELVVIRSVKVMQDITSHGRASWQSKWEKNFAVFRSLLVSKWWQELYCLTKHFSKFFLSF